MPLVNISLRRGSTVTYRRAIADGVHLAMVDALEIAPDDRFELIHELDMENMLHDPQFLGIDRSEGSIFIQLFLNERPIEQKHALFGNIVERLTTTPGVRKEDIFIGIVDVTPANWWAYARRTP